MRLRSLASAASIIGVVMALSTTASAATFFVQYFEVPATQGGDFGPCCSSPSPATQPVVALGSALGAHGMPVTTLAAGGVGNGVIDQNASGEILWWTPSAATGVTATGSGMLPFPLVNQNMFAPNSTGVNNNNFFETAILSGTFTGTGSPESLTVTSDDDAFVYLDGLFVGGNPGVHDDVTSTINLGSLTGTHTLQVFYADRAHTDADLSISGVGLNTLTGTGGGVPEPSVWAMMVLGFGGIGALLRSHRKIATAAAA